METNVIVRSACSRKLVAACLAVNAVFFAGNVAAADLTASSVNPTVNWNDTDTPAIEWRLIGDEAAMTLFDELPSSHVSLAFDGLATTTAMQQHSDNDLSLAGGQAYIDYSRDFGGVTAYAAGFGTAAPVDALHIVHPFPAVRLDDGGTGVWSLEENADDLRIRNETDGSDRITIQAVTGNVGINNTSPAETLDVGGKIKAAFAGTNSLGDGMTKVFTMNANNADLAKSSDVGFQLTNDRSGFSWAFRTFEGPQGFAATKQGTGGSELTIENITTDYRNVVLRLGSGATNTNGQWINASSREYKDNIRDLSAADAIQALEALNPVTYTFKNDASKDLNVGFIAEDTPDLVATPDRKGLNPLEVVATLTRVVKEQQKTLQEQQAVLQKQQQLLDSLLQERAERQKSEPITTSLLVQ